jgi:site-specific DNA recombinase
MEVKGRRHRMNRTRTSTTQDQPRRVLGAGRLSHLTDETLSPEVQRERLTGAVRPPDTLVYITMDLDVSGAVSAFDRAELGPWLTDPDRIALWDVLMVVKLDRLTRSLLDFQRILQWCEANGKAIISLSEGFDLSTPVGKMIANILVMFAEFERERMGERRSERAQADKARGWFGGGRTKYGFRAVKVDDHHEVEEDPAEKAVAERMARMILAGKSATHIARTLTAEGIPTKLGDVKKGSRKGQPREWSGSTILAILTDPDGILDTDLWTKVQPVIKDASRPKVNRYGDSVLAGIAHCGECGTEMHSQHTRRGESVWQYYRCSNRECPARMIRAEDLDAIVDADFLEVYGDVEELVRVLVPGSDIKRQLDQIDRELDALNAKRASRSVSVSEFRATQDMLLTEQERLEGLPAEPDTYEWAGTGRTYRDMWQSLDDEGKHAWLLRHEVRVQATAGAKRGDVPVIALDWGKGISVTPQLAP